MNKYLPITALCAICLLMICGAAQAVCPVCTIAVGAGLEGARLLGVDDAITGVWAGGFTLILVFWTAKFMHKNGIKNGLWYLLDFAVYYGLLAMVYLMPDVKFGANTLWGIDKFLLGAAIGTVALWAAEKWNASIIRGNNGKSKFKFQKVVMPVGALMAASLALWAAI